MKKWRILIILSMTTFIIVIDTTIMNVSISALVEDLSTTVTGVQSAVTLYALIMASFFITGSKIGDIVGRKKTFIIGLIIYGFGTTITAFAQNITMLLIGWSVLEGIGAAMMLPILQTLLRGNYEKNDLPICYSVIGAVTAGGAALGPIAGGFLTTYLSWRYAFLIELLIVIIVLVFAKIIKDIPYKSIEKPQLDIGGVFLSTIGLTALVYGIIQAQNYGFIFAKNPYMIGKMAFAPFNLSITAVLTLFSIVTLSGFVWWQKKRESQNKMPLIRPSIFKTPGLKPGLIVALIQSFTQMGILFTLPLLLQITFSFTAFETGIIMLPLSLALLTTSLLGIRLSKKMLPRNIILIGLTFMVIGIFLIIHNTTSSVDTTKLWPGLTVIGAAMGLIVSQLINLILSLVDPNESSETASLISTSQQLGASLGTAVAGTVLLITLSTSVTAQTHESTVFTEEEKIIVETAARDQIDFVSDDQLYTALKGQKKDVTNELITINSVARIQSIKFAMFCIAIITTIGLIAGIYLPRKKLHD